MTQATRRTWFPLLHQVQVVERKGNPYLHSLWVGLALPIIHLPELIWNALRAESMLGGFGNVLIAIALSVVAGISGRAAGIVEADEQK